MNVQQLKQLRTSVALTGLLAGVLTLSACQQQPESEPSLEDISTEQSVPMSAEPAEPSNIVVNTEAASLNDVQEDTVASVNTNVSQITYLCSPELRVEATYKDAENQVIIGTAQGTLTLSKTNDASNPAVFEVDSAMDGGEGFVQWHVAHEKRDTGMLRTAGANTDNVSTYECQETE